MLLKRFRGLNESFQWQLNLIEEYRFLFQFKKEIWLLVKLLFAKLAILKCIKFYESIWGKNFEVIFHKKSALSTFCNRLELFFRIWRYFLAASINNLLKLIAMGAYTQRSIKLLEETLFVAKKTSFISFSSTKTVVSNKPSPYI